MKIGQTIEELSQELLEQQSSKRDFHTQTKTLNMLPTGRFRLETKDEEILMPATAHAHGQMASKLNMPKVYYDRMLRQCPELLAQNVNHWLGETEDTSLIRSLRGQIRAVLSNRYRIVDHRPTCKLLRTISSLGIRRKRSS